MYNACVFKHLCKWRKIYGTGKICRCAVECEESQGGCGNAVRDGVQPGGGGGEGGSCVSKESGDKLQLCGGGVGAVSACTLGSVKWPGNSYS